jgi:EAL domain-containing protein (putative c-di-GMP-specific phosphodiesterase class I)
MALSDDRFQKFHAAFADAPTAVVVWNVETGEILDANNALCRIFGREYADLIGQGYDDLLPPNTSHPNADSSDFTWEASIVHPDGYPVRFRVVARMIPRVTITTTPGGPDMVALGYLEEAPSLRSPRSVFLERDLFAALEAEEFVLYYQPIVEIETGTIVGFESLLRWQRGDNLLLASEFIKIAEESTAIVHIDNWVMGEAHQQMVEWKPLIEHMPRSVIGRSPSIGINLSGRDVAYGSVESRLRRATGNDVGCLSLELTESSMMANHVEPFLEELHHLQDEGVYIALDDFGTGWSSLTYLKHFAVNAIKIDASFVAGLGNNADDEAICRAVIALGHSLNLQVIAEGVEHPTQLEILRHLGCDAVQGHLIGAPISAEETTALLHNLIASRQP